MRFLPVTNPRYRTMLQRAGIAAYLLLAVCHADAQESKPKYEVTIIQGPSCGFLGPAPIFLNDLNDSGIVVGSYEHCVDTDLDVGFIWTAQTGMTVLQPLPSMNTIVPLGINDQNQLTGLVTFSGDDFGWIVFMAQMTQFTGFAFPDSLDGTFSRGIAINNNGWIVGDWGNTVTGVPTPEHALLWRDGELIDLGSQLLGPINRAHDINNHGHIVGRMGSSLGGRAFLWQDEVVIDLGVLPKGIASSASAISNRGIIVGSSSIPGPTPWGTVSHPVRWENFAIYDLGVLPGLDTGGAGDVNDRGEIVGGCSDALTGGSNRGFLWRDGVMWDLNDLIDPDLGLEIIGGGSINNVGQIATIAFNQDGDRVGVVLTPIKNPDIHADLNDDGIVDGDDLMMLLSSWSIPPSSPGCKGAAFCAPDINGDGLVNGLDLGILLANWTL